MFAGIISANTQIVKVEVEGMGESLQSAIDRGLTEAMGGVNGRSIESEILSKTSEQVNIKIKQKNIFPPQNTRIKSSPKPKEL